jgi:two-component system OmpR family response regulator
MRVLVVEDNPQVAKQLANALQRGAYVVDVAADGEVGEFLGHTEP